MPLIAARRKGSGGIIGLGTSTVTRTGVMCHNSWRATMVTWTRR
jgi:hypothetical protein